MATISKHYGKWQAQLRIKDYPNRTKSFLFKKSYSGNLVNNPPVKTAIRSKIINNTGKYK